MHSCIFEQRTWTRSIADENKGSLSCTHELRNWDFYKKHCRQDGLRWPSKCMMTRQVRSLVGRLCPRIRVQINGVCGRHRYGCKQGPKISLHCLLSKDGEAKEQEGKEPTDKHQVLPCTRPSTSGRVALQAGARCPGLSGLCPLLCLLAFSHGCLDLASKAWKGRISSHCFSSSPMALIFGPWGDDLGTAGGPSPQCPCPAALGEPSPYWGKHSFISRSDLYSLSNVIFVQEVL